MKKKSLRAVVGIVLALALTSNFAVAQAATKKPAKAQSAADVGGLKDLIKLAKKEGELNTIALPDYWANYGNVIKRFSEKYGIKVNSYDPEASSAEELVAVRTLKGQDRMPDVLDVGLQFAVQGAQEGLLQPSRAAEAGQPAGRTPSACRRRWWRGTAHAPAALHPPSARPGRPRPSCR